MTKHYDGKKARILIVDDHPVVRYGLTQLIQDEPDLEVCGQAADAEKALEMVRTLKPDLSLIDISLKGTSGMELIKAIKTQDKWGKMLVHSMHDESLFAERAIHAGALGYIHKQEAPDKIIEAIRQVLRGQVYLSARMTERMMQRVMGGKGKVEESPILTLSDRELEVFEQIGKGLSTREIADKLHLSVKTVETYRDHIKAKLALDNSTELMRQAMLWTFDQS
jgi:DNA-binding NarL/FixJ family response regulator